MKSIVVFCGSSEGKNQHFKKQAYLLGETLAQNKIQLIYGGSKAGLMGAVANGSLSKGGSVIGILPSFLKHKEIAHTELNELIIVDSMHERKTKMHELCEGIIALPGGFGTMEELFEVLTWAQLGHHQKPIGLLNMEGYYNPLLNMIDSMLAHGYSKPEFKELLLVSDNIDDLLDKVNHYQAPKIHKWMASDEI